MAPPPPRRRPTPEERAERLQALLDKFERKYAAYDLDAHLARIRQLSPVWDERDRQRRDIFRQVYSMGQRVTVPSVDLNSARLAQLLAPEQPPRDATTWPVHPETPFSATLCANPGCISGPGFSRIRNNPKQPHRACSRCWLVTYCSEDCQREDWPVHKHLCVPLSDEGRERVQLLESRNRDLEKMLKEFEMTHFALHMPQSNRQYPDAFWTERDTARVMALVKKLDQIDAKMAALTIISVPDGMSTSDVIRHVAYADARQRYNELLHFRVGVLEELMFKAAPDDFSYTRRMAEVATHADRLRSQFIQYMWETCMAQFANDMDREPAMKRDAGDITWSEYFATVEFATALQRATDHDPRFDDLAEWLDAVASDAQDSGEWDDLALYAERVQETDRALTEAAEAIDAAHQRGELQFPAPPAAATEEQRQQPLPPADHPGLEHVRQLDAGILDFWRNLWGGGGRAGGAGGAVAGGQPAAAPPAPQRPPVYLEGYVQSFRLGVDWNQPITGADWGAMVAGLVAGVAWQHFVDTRMVENGQYTAGGLGAAPADLGTARQMVVDFVPPASRAARVDPALAWITGWTTRTRNTAIAFCDMTRMATAATRENAESARGNAILRARPAAAANAVFLGSFTKWVPRWYLSAVRRTHMRKQMLFVDCHNYGVDAVLDRVATTPNASPQARFDAYESGFNVAKNSLEPRTHMVQWGWAATANLLEDVVTSLGSDAFTDALEYFAESLTDRILNAKAKFEAEILGRPGSYFTTYIRLDEPSKWGRVFGFLRLAVMVVNIGLLAYSVYQGNWEGALLAWSVQKMDIESAVKNVWNWFADRFRATEAVVDPANASTTFQWIGQIAPVFDRISGSLGALFRVGAAACAFFISSVMFGTGWFRRKLAEHSFDKTVKVLDWLWEMLSPLEDYHGLAYLSLLYQVASHYETGGPVASDLATASVFIHTLLAWWTTAVPTRWMEASFNPARHAETIGADGNPARDRQQQQQQQQQQPQQQQPPIHGTNSNNANSYNTTNEWHQHHHDHYHYHPPPGNDAGGAGGQPARGAAMQARTLAAAGATAKVPPTVRPVTTSNEQRKSEAAAAATSTPTPPLAKEEEAIKAIRAWSTRATGTLGRLLDTLHGADPAHFPISGTEFRRTVADYRVALSEQAAVLTSIAADAELDQGAAVRKLDAALRNPVLYDVARLFRHAPFATPEVAAASVALEARDPVDVFFDAVIHAVDTEWAPQILGLLERALAGDGAASDEALRQVVAGPFGAALLAGRRKKRQRRRDKYQPDQVAVDETDDHVTLPDVDADPATLRQQLADMWKDIQRVYGAATEVAADVGSGVAGAFAKLGPRRGLILMCAIQASWNVAMAAAAGQHFTDAKADADLGAKSEAVCMTVVRYTNETALAEYNRFTNKQDTSACAAVITGCNEILPTIECDTYLATMKDFGQHFQNATDIPMSKYFSKLGDVDRSVHGPSQFLKNILPGYVTEREVDKVVEFCQPIDPNNRPALDQPLLARLAAFNASLPRLKEMFVADYKTDTDRQVATEFFDLATDAIKGHNFVGPEVDMNVLRAHPDVVNRVFPQATAFLTSTAYGVCAKLYEVDQKLCDKVAQAEANTASANAMQQALSDLCDTIVKGLGWEGTRYSDILLSIRRLEPKTWAMFTGHLLGAPFQQATNLAEGHWWRKVSGFGSIIGIVGERIGRVLVTTLERSLWSELFFAGFMFITLRMLHANVADSDAAFARGMFEVAGSGGSRLLAYFANGSNVVVNAISHVVAQGIAASVIEAGTAVMEWANLTARLGTDFGNPRFQQAMRSSEAFYTFMADSKASGKLSYLDTALFTTARSLRMVTRHAPLLSSFYVRDAEFAPLRQFQVASYVHRLASGVTDGFATLDPGLKCYAAISLLSFLALGYASHGTRADLDPLTQNQNHWAMHALEATPILAAAYASGAYTSATLTAAVIFFENYLEQKGAAEGEVAFRDARNARTTNFSAYARMGVAMFGTGNVLYANLPAWAQTEFLHLLGAMGMVAAVAFGTRVHAKLTKKD